MHYVVRRVCFVHRIPWQVLSRVSCECRNLSSMMNNDDDDDWQQMCHARSIEPKLSSTRDRQTNSNAKWVAAARSTPALCHFSHVDIVFVWVHPFIQEFNNNQCCDSLSVATQLSESGGGSSPSGIISISWPTQLTILSNLIQLVCVASTYSQHERHCRRLCSTIYIEWNYTA